MATYNISTLAQLQAIAPTHLADDCVLLNNIDASATETDEVTYPAGFVPIGTAAAPFTGSFDGDNFIISNLYIKTASNEAIGLLGQGAITTKTIKDVTLSNVNITNTGAGSTGAIFGELSGSDVSNRATVSNCHSSGTITGNVYSGGLVGSSSYANYASCTANITMTMTGATSGNSRIGGFVGMNLSCNYTSCVSSGSITSSITGNRDRYIGGFVGYANKGASAAGVSTFTSCSSSVSILSTHTYAAATTSVLGGFVGQGYVDGINESVFTLCGSTSSIVETGSCIYLIGGFAGFSNASTTKCRATGNVSCPNATILNTTGSIGGFSGSCAASTDCYASGSVCEDGISNVAIRLGGFAGIASGNQTNCYSRGFVLPEGSYGGFAGVAGAGTKTSCYWDTETSGTTVAASSGTITGITGKTTAQMKLEATFTSWDFASIWELTSYSRAAVSASNLTVWPSKSGDYDNFLEGTKDADSFQTDIPSTNEIRWIDSQEALLIGTAGDEWKLSSNKLDTPLSPTNHGSKRQSGHGSAYMQAINVNEVILFVDSVRRKVREMAFDPGTDKYMCPDMTSLSEHITAGQIKWMAYQKNPNSILWVGLDTGDVRGFVYDREQNVTAWFKVNLGGNGACQSGCVIPGETEDEIYLVVNRTIAGSFVYDGTEQVYAGDDAVIMGGGDKVYLERFSARELTAKADAFFVDCGITWETSGAYVDQDVYAGTQQIYSGTEPVVMSVFDSTAPSSTITGLNHLEGETVKILADGVVADDAVVTSGQVTIQIGGVTTTAYKAQVGLAYTSKLQPMRLVLGDSLGKKTRANSLVLSLLDTGACKYGPDSTDQRDVDLAEIGLTNTSEITGLFTGETEVSQAAGFDPLNPVVITSDAPLPLVARCIAVDLDRTG